VKFVRVRNFYFPRKRQTFYFFYKSFEWFNVIISMSLCQEYLLFEYEEYNIYVLSGMSLCTIIDLDTQIRIGRYLLKVQNFISVYVEEDIAALLT